MGRRISRLAFSCIAAFAAAGSLADDLRFDQRAADKDATLRQLTIDTRLCTRDAAQTMLRAGSRDSNQIVAFATKLCSPSLTAFLTAQGQRSDIVEAYVRALAYEELTHIPGLTPGAGASRPSTHRPGDTSPPPPEAARSQKPAGLAIPVGAFRDPEPITARLKSAGIPHYTEEITAAYTGVRAGPFISQEDAETARRRLRELGFKPGDIYAR